MGRLVNNGVSSKVFKDTLGRPFKVGQKVVTVENERLSFQEVIKVDGKGVWGKKGKNHLPKLLTITNTLII